jgi:hypothetical protein
MPYIKQEMRGELDKIIDEFFNVYRVPESDSPDFFLPPKGELNYFFSQICWQIFDMYRSYDIGADMVSTLECVKQEFIRRKLNPYEDKKIFENGDL